MGVDLICVRCTTSSEISMRLKNQIDMVGTNITKEVYTPTYVQLLLDRSVKLRREARVEWLNIRDSLTLEQNAHYMDAFRDIDDQNRRLRDMLKGHEQRVQAELN
jgi:hypothetical protein